MKTARTRTFLWTLAAFSAASICNAASAHDVWLTFAGDAAFRRVIVNYGHPGDRPPSVADKILDLIAVKADGRTSLLAGVAPAQENGVYIVTSRPFEDSGHILTATRYDNGFWIRTADGAYRNVTRRLVPDAADSLWSSKFAKAITGPGSPWQTVLGHDLELVPLADPGAVTPGQSLKLQVLFLGKPLAGAEVERGDGVTVVPEKDIPRFTTDAEGIASIPIVKSGPLLLVIDHKVTPSKTADQANSDLYTATLWFTVTGKRADTRQQIAK